MSAALLSFEAVSYRYPGVDAPALETTAVYDHIRQGDPV